MTTQPETARVEQVDLECAASIYQHFRDYDYARWILSGENATGIHDTIIQMVVRHRATAYAAGLARAAEIAEDFADPDVRRKARGERSSFTEPNDTCKNIAAAIRTEIGEKP